MSVDTDITVGMNYVFIFQVYLISLQYNYTANKHSLSYLNVDLILPDELHVIALSMRIVRKRDIANF